MPCYDYINGSLKKVSKIYDYVGGALKEVKEGYDYIDGALKLYHTGGVPIYGLPLGSRVLHNGVYYTLIAKDYCVAGDVILWEESPAVNSSNLSDAERIPQTAYENPTTAGYTARAGIPLTPFGELNTNEVAIKYQDVVKWQTVGGEQMFEKVQERSVTALGWMLPAMAADYIAALGSNHTPVSLGSPPMPYFISDISHRKRITSYVYPDIYGTQYEYNIAFKRHNFIFVNANGTDLIVSPTYTAQKIDYYFAYSVKGALMCGGNSDGTFTLQI